MRQSRAGALIQLLDEMRTTQQVRPERRDKQLCGQDGRRHKRSRFMDSVELKLVWPAAQTPVGDRGQDQFFAAGLQSVARVGQRLAMGISWTDGFVKIQCGVGVSGNPLSHTGSKLTARNWSKYSQLICQNGTWGNQQILDKATPAECFRETEAHPEHR